MAAYRHRALRVRLAAIALVLGILPAQAETFQQMWMGRVARPPADNEEASVYWEDKWDARGKRFKPNEVSCAHRTEAFGTIFIVTNLDNGKKIECPVQDRGPFAKGRVLDFSLGAAKKDRLRRSLPRHRAARRLRIAHNAGCAVPRPSATRLQNEKSADPEVRASIKSDLNPASAQ